MQHCRTMDAAEVFTTNKQSSINGYIYIGSTSLVEFYALVYSESLLLLLEVGIFLFFVLLQLRNY